MVLFPVPHDYMNLEDWAQNKGSRLDYKAVVALKAWFCDPRCVARLGGRQRVLRHPPARSPAADT